MEYPNYQPFPEFQSHEFNPPTCQPDHSCHYTFFPSHPYQTHSSEAGNSSPTWSNEDRQTRNNPYHPDLTCPDQPQYQRRPRQSFEPTIEEDCFANIIKGEIKGVTVFQQNMQSCTRAEAETIMNIQHSYEEQQSHVDDMIRQIALQTEMLREVQENRARTEEDGNNEKQKKTSRADGESAANEEKKSEALLEGAEAVEVDSDEEEIQTEEEVDDALFYLQSKVVHVPDEKVADITTKVRRAEERPPPTINKTEGSYDEKEGPEPKEERSRRKAARSIY